MRRLLFAVMPFAITSLVHAAPAEQPKAQIHNSAMAFVKFWDANKDKPKTEQLAAFTTEVATAFPAFYGADRIKGDNPQARLEGRIDAAIKGFPAIREQYVHKAQQFETELPKHVATFRKWFPDYKQDGDIYVLHSLGEMDGGMRTIGGKRYMIFGVDVMAQYHGWGDESAFFHHELFHFYHVPRMNDCTGWPMWLPLWQEGLAAYVSKAMNPQASDKELAFDIPDAMAERTRAALPAALAHLESVLDKEDQATYSGLFSRKGDNTGLPGRRGYYLGYLVAAEAAKTRTVQELAQLKCGEVRELVHATVKSMNAAAAGKGL